MTLVKSNWSSNPNVFGFDSLNWVELPSVSPGAGVVTSTVQTQKLIPYAVKVPIIAVYTGAIALLDGSHQFNIVSGTGSYDTGAVAATQTVTITGSPTTTNNNVYTIGGTAVTVAQTTGNTVTQQAVTDIAAINANTTVNKLVKATNLAGVITLTAIEAGVAGNAITVVAASGGGDTLTAGGGTLTGGANATGVTLAPTDNSLTNAFNDGTGWGSNPTLGGLGVPTVFGAAGDALFSTDQLLTTTSGVGVAPTTGQPALPTPATGADSFWRFVPTNYDAVWPACTLFTLRVLTPAVSGSITSLLVVLGTIPVRTKQSVESTGLIITPGVDF